MVIRSTGKPLQFVDEEIGGTSATAASIPPQPLAHMLHRATQLAELQLSKSLAVQEAGLTARQFVVLSAVSRQNGVNQVALTRETGIDRSTLGAIVQRLARRGWLTRRRRKDDARANAIRITQPGLEMLSKAQPGFARTDAELIASLPQHLRDPFLAGLTAIAGAYDQE